MKELNDIAECPLCGGTAGFYDVTLNRQRMSFDWKTGEAFDESLDYISGGDRKVCLDCEKIVSKFGKIAS